MPKTIYLPVVEGTEEDRAWNSGITVTYTASSNKIDISAYYDGGVGIEGQSMTLDRFFKVLGIPAKNIKKAMEKL